MRVSVACASRSAASSSGRTGDSPIAPVIGSAQWIIEPALLEQCRPVTADLRGATVVVVGLGDLGARVAAAVARLPVGRVVAISRDARRVDEVVGQATVIAGLAGGAERVEGLVG